MNYSSSLARAVSASKKIPEGQEFNHEIIMSNRNIHIFLKTIAVSLLVLLRAGAEEPESAKPEQCYSAFSEPMLVVIPIKERPDFYRKLSKDEKYSNEFREYAGKRYRLSVIRQNMLDLLQRVHDQESAESAVATILAYDKEVAEMDMRQAYFQSRRKANSEEGSLHETLLTYERMDCENIKKKMLRCIVNRNLFQYETLERELKPRLQGLWNYFIYMPSFYVSTDRLMVAYKDIHEDPACSAGFRKFVAKCLQLSELLSRVLEALSMIHDEASAIEAGNILKQYDDEIDSLEIRMCYYREVRGKLSKEEE